MKTALITGVTGFVGSHLLEFLQRKRIDDDPIRIIGQHRRRSRMDNLAFLHNQPDFGTLKLVECDLCDSHDTTALVTETQPDYIFHLAAQSFVPTSWAQPTETMCVNTSSTINLLEAVRRTPKAKTTRILVVGSSEEYGLVHRDEIPIKETNPLRPLSPYAVSKVAQDLLGYQYAQSYGMYIVRSRAFNHEGPRRGAEFVTSAFAKQIAEIEANLRGRTVMVGNLDAIRDFTDVRDVVRAYYLLLTSESIPSIAGSVFNICSGKTWTMALVLEYLLAASNLREVKIEKDPARMRPSDVPILVGNHNALTLATGWEPEIPFEKTLSDTLDYWRERVKR